MYKRQTQMVADHVGADLHRLTSELDKLLISLPENDRRVTPEIVEREIGAVSYTHLMIRCSIPIYYTLFFIGNLSLGTGSVLLL